MRAAPQHMQGDLRYGNPVGGLQPCTRPTELPAASLALPQALCNCATTLAAHFDPLVQAMRKRWSDTISEGECENPRGLGTQLV